MVLIMANISACTISFTFIYIVMHLLLTLDMKPSLAMILHNHDPEPAIVESGGVYRRRYPLNSNGRGSFHRSSRANNAYKGLFAPLNKQGEIDQKRQYYEKKMAEWREKNLAIILDRLGEDYVLVRNPDDDSLESEELKKASDKFVSLWEGFYDISGEEDDLIDTSEESTEQYNYENYVDDSSSATTATPKDNGKYTTEKITTERTTTTEVSATEKSTTKKSITEKFTSTRQNHSLFEPTASPTIEPNKLPQTTPILSTSAIQDPTQKRAYYEKKMAEWKVKQKGCLLNRSSGKDSQHETKWKEIMQNDGSKEVGQSLNAAFRPVNFINE